MKRLRFKYLQKKFFIWQDMEFLRKVRSNELIGETLFSSKKITKIEQEEWFNSFYSQIEDYHIWLIYHEQKKCAIGYVMIKIDNIKHRRIEFNYIISPEFNYIKCDRAILNWIKYKSKSIEIDMHKIFCYVMPENEKRIEKLVDNGFEVDCILREHIYKNDCYHSVIIISKLIS